jgi:hypothetical protein
VEDESDKIGRAPLSDENRKALIAGALVGLCFPFFWPAGFWANLLASMAACGLVYGVVYLLLRRRRDR